MDSKTAAKTYGNIVFTTQLGIVFIGDISISFLYEIVGRRIVMSAGLFISAVSIFCVTLPHHLFLMYFVKFFMGLGVVPTLVSPLIADYSKMWNRSLSNSYMFVVGSVGVLTVTKLLPWIANTWGLRISSFVFSAMMFTMGILMVILIKNPVRRRAKLQGIYFFFEDLSFHSILFYNLEFNCNI